MSYAVNYQGVYLQARRQRQILYVGDETEKSASTSTYSSVKTFRFLLHGTLYPPSQLMLFVRLRVSGPSLEGGLGLFLDADTDPIIEVMTESETYELLHGTADIRSLSEGVHLADLRLKTTGGTVYNDFVESYFLYESPR